jgi:hypothetical protein
MYEGMNGAFPSNAGPDITVKGWLGESVQDAVDNVTDVNNDGYLIVLVIAKSDGTLGGTINQKVAVDKNYGTAKSFGLFGCSVTMTGGGSDPSVWIKPSATSKDRSVNGRTFNVFLMDLHGGNSSAAGVQAEGTKRYVRNEYGVNSAVGIKVLGNNNTVHNGKAEGNSGYGVYVEGDSNYLTDTDSFANGSDGFHIKGNSNQLLKLNPGDKGKGNGGNGVAVNGTSNLLSEIKAYANTGWGINVGSVVASATNTLNKNVAGASGKGNTAGGIRVSGTGNLLTENSAFYNTGPGFSITGAATSATANAFVKNNKAGNQTTDYNLNNYVKNTSGGNQSDGVTIPKTTSPAKCVGTFPAQGATTNFANTSCT